MTGPARLVPLRGFRIDHFGHLPSDPLDCSMLCRYQPTWWTRLRRRWRR